MKLHALLLALGTALLAGHAPAAERGISYFTWGNERLRRLRLVPKPPAAR